MGGEVRRAGCAAFQSGRRQRWVSVLCVVSDTREG